MGVSTPGAGLYLSQVSRVPLSSKSLPSVEDTLLLYVLNPVNLPTSTQHDSREVLPDAPSQLPAPHLAALHQQWPGGTWQPTAYPIHSTSLLIKM